ncbi:MAG TPA: SDR family NAD(P)-dependent oxidoreductase [Acidimicrobiales bacterium]|nr:SDR family NAD(P)-dependent oxidoreductase [Acidimicrobiales bacterium]
MGRRDFDLSGTRALVTGAGSGIGRAIALELARKGSHVLAVDQHGETAEKTALACSEIGPEARDLTCDVTDSEAVRDLAGRVEADHGGIDVLVNNAGVGMTGHFVDMSIDDWRWIRAVNLDGVVHCCHAFGPGLLARGRAQVVNVASALAYTPRSTEVAYVTTKAAVLAFSQCLRADWAASGVGVTAACPGVINTPILESTRFVNADDEEAEDVAERAAKLFAVGHSPELVARDVVMAIRVDKAVVLSGFEARMGWYGHRLLPVRAQQRIARRRV